MLPTRDEQDLLLADLELDRLRWTTQLYYLHETNPDNGLVRDKTDPAAPCSIAVVGMAMATLPIAVERDQPEKETAVVAIGYEGTMT
jgi:hypothetical protein